MYYLWNNSINYTYKQLDLDYKFDESNNYIDHIVDFINNDNLYKQNFLNNFII